MTTQAETPQERDATMKQAARILTAITEKNPNRIQVTALLASGILSDLVTSDFSGVTEDTRNKIALLLGTVPYCTETARQIDATLEGDVFELSADYVKPIEELVVDARIKKGVLESLNGKKYPNMSGPARARYSLLYFSRNMHLDYILQFLERDGYIQTNIRELIAFAKSRVITNLRADVWALDSPSGPYMNKRYSRPRLKWKFIQYSHGWELHLASEEAIEDINFCSPHGYVLARLKNH